MNITRYDYKKEYKVTKTVYSTGKTKLVYGTVGRTYKTEQEAMNDIDNFVIVASDIMDKEYRS